MARTAAPRRSRSAPAPRRRKPAGKPPSRWRRLIAWIERSHPVARMLVAVVAPVATIVTTLLALGVVTPFGSGDALAQGAESTVEAGTSRIALSVAADGQAGTTRYEATGAFDYRTGRGRLRYDFSATPGLAQITAVDARFNDAVVFMRFPASTGVPPARPWVRVELAATDKLLSDAAAAGALPESAPELGIVADIGLADPSRVLEDLRQGGDVEDLGEERIFGVPTHKYRGTLGAGVTATAWIADDHLIRRLALSGDGEGGRVETTMDFTDFGVPVDAEPPPPARTTDITELLARLVARG